MVSNQKQHPLNLINFSCSWPGKGAPANCELLLNRRSTRPFWSVQGRALIFSPHMWALWKLPQQIKKKNSKFGTATTYIHSTAYCSPTTSKDALKTTHGKREQLETHCSHHSLVLSLPAARGAAVTVCSDWRKLYAPRKFGHSSSNNVRSFKYNTANPLWWENP